MPGVEAIRVSGCVVEVLTHRLVRVELENDHRMMGHTTRATSGLLAEAAVGDTVVLEISTFDLSKGRVVQLNSLETTTK
ncbi:MAG: translation initiation factor IF-1 [Verrucomicrobiota bacterium]|nr:translation initiation factor IF-1 [Verrucomicrobiota bacterium]